MDKLNFWFYYHKLVDTFHIVCECNTAVYFSWCLIQALAQPVQLFWPLVTFSVASGNSLTHSDLQLFTETEHDRLTRHSFTQYYPSPDLRVIRNQTNEKVLRLFLTISLWMSLKSRVIQKTISVKLGYNKL